MERKRASEGHSLTEEGRGRDWTLSRLGTAKGRGQRKKDTATTHPKRLLGEKVLMPTPKPQAARAESAGGVGLGPREVCAEPARVSSYVPCFHALPREEPKRHES